MDTTELECKVLDLEITALKKSIEKGRPIVWPPIARRTAATPAPARSAAASFSARRSAAGWEYRDSAGKVLPDNRVLWPTQTRKLVEQHEEADKARRGRGGMLISSPCFEPVSMQ